MPEVCVQELETIMDDDEDMADLYLTVIALCQQKAGSVSLSILGAADMQARVLRYIRRIFLCIL